MSTQEVADRLIQMCREGKNLDAINELYADDVTSKEMPGAPNDMLSGIKEVYQKSEDWLANVQEFHGGDITDPVVAGDHFTTKMAYDVTFKEGGRQQMEEVCVYQVRNGKIVSEQFFYEMPPS